MTAARQRLGARGEELAARWYRRRGYRVIERNWRCRHGEIDLVCSGRGTVVFCEVKTRSSDRFGTGAEAVTTAKSRRIRRLASAWLAEHPGGGRRVRFDVVAVTGGDVQVIEAAF